MPARRILLVSLSPRRRRLLALLGLEFDVACVDTPEELDSPLAADPSALAVHLAEEKILAARAEGLGDDAFMLTFDTIVVHEGRLLGKPLDPDDARSMLRSLSGKTHQVVTGVSMLCPDDESPRSFSVTSQVRMKELDDAQIEAWMSTGEFMGCAGAYNIESQIAQVDGSECFQNVAGLPLCHLYAALTGEQAPPCLPQRPHAPLVACDKDLDRACEIGRELLER